MLVAPTPTSVRTAVVRNWFEAVSELDADALDKFFTENYVSAMLPASMGVPEKKKQTALEHVRNTAALLEGGKPTKVEVYSFAENENQVWAHIRLTAKTTTGIPYDAESIYIFTLETSGKDPRIERVAEFADSAGLARLASAMAGQK